ncbi:multiple sugar transport system substrate-binding protein [Gracilibacillus ureilyticus]|uniref:Multiple sugar transport system substrate-binding protein n=1 Tax=Gracilibacillus ureilyticus TaxID=531814 RepID=A0A1H9QAW8_9BACI|nr:ABC transporter substrate-binding protein [Gracilibacillus ureilyticus]SER56963.1 multiple sugar transport system substrate-binding protein [Gracilibacillus ureilyticus]
MKKLSLLGIAGLFLVLLLAACGGNEETNEAQANSEDTEQENTESAEESAGEEASSEPVEVEFWHAMSGPHEEAIKAFVEQFNNEHENITVKPVNQGSYDDLEQKIMAGAKAKLLPTLAQAVTNVVPEYIGNDFITPLNEFIEDGEIGLSEEELADYVDVFKESSSWDGTYYSLPFSKSTRILFYNTGLLEEHGLEVPETWEDIRTIAETVTGDGVVGMGFENSYESEFQALLKQLGGTYIDEASNEAQFASAEGIEAMTMIKDMIDEGIARTAGEDDYMSNPFGRGDVAMYIGSSAGIPHVASAAEGNIEWSATTLPTLDGEAATTFAGNDIVMFNQAEEAEQKAAWEFIKFLTSPEVTAEWSMKSGYLPVRYSAQETPDYKTFVEENPEYKAGTEQFDAGFFIARVQGGDAVRNIVLEETELILLGEKTVEEGLQSAQDRANETLQK